MITLRRIHIESPLSADDLRARVERAMGRSALGLFDPKWSGDIDTPFIGEMTGNSFKAMRRARYRYATVCGSIAGNVIDAEVGLPVWIAALSLMTLVFFPFAILTFVMTWNDMNRIEEKLRQIGASATR